MLKHEVTNSESAQRDIFIISKYCKIVIKTWQRLIRVIFFSLLNVNCDNILEIINEKDDEENNREEDLAVILQKML